MKYALLFFLFAITYSTQTFARTINSFNDSPAIITIAQFMLDNAEDMPSSVRISDKKLILKDTSCCIDVTSGDIEKEVQAAIKTVLRLYPDEELPIAEALNDLSDYAGTGPLKKCMLLQNNDHQLLKTIYFFDGRDQVHVKVDTITLGTH